MEQTQEDQQTARRPERESLRPSRRGEHLMVRNILNLVFMIAAVVGVILYVKSPATLFGISLGGLLIGFAIVVKVVEVVVRMMK